MPPPTLREWKCPACGLRIFAADGMAIGHEAPECRTFLAFIAGGPKDETMELSEVVETYFGELAKKKSDHVPTTTAYRKSFEGFSVELAPRVTVTHVLPARSRTMRLHQMQLLRPREACDLDVMSIRADEREQLNGGPVLGTAFLVSREELVQAIAVRCKYGGPTGELVNLLNHARPDVICPRGCFSYSMGAQFRRALSVTVKNRSDEPRLFHGWFFIEEDLTSMPPHVEREEDVN
jgi:hypothetical protein